MRFLFVNFLLYGGAFCILAALLLLLCLFLYVVILQFPILGWLGIITFFTGATFLTIYNMMGEF